MTIGTKKIIYISSYYFEYFLRYLICNQFLYTGGYRDIVTWHSDLTVEMTINFECTWSFVESRYILNIIFNRITQLSLLDKSKIYQQFFQSFVFKKKSQLSNVKSQQIPTINISVGLRKTRKQNHSHYFYSHT